MNLCYCVTPNGPQGHVAANRHYRPQIEAVLQRMVVGGPACVKKHSPDAAPVTDAHSSQGGGTPIPASPPGQKHPFSHIVGTECETVTVGPLRGEGHDSSKHPLLHVELAATRVSKENIDVRNVIPLPLYAAPADVKHIDRARLAHRKP